MADYDNTNRGIVSKNDRKTEDKHPDIKGKINVEGVEYWLDGWRKTRTSDGQPFYSLSVKRKDAPQEPVRGVTRAAKPAVQELDDDIPF